MGNKLKRVFKNVGVGIDQKWNHEDNERKKGFAQLL